MIHISRFAAVAAFALFATAVGAQDAPPPQQPAEPPAASMQTPQADPADAAPEEDADAPAPPPRAAPSRRVPVRTVVAPAPATVVVPAETTTTTTTAAAPPLTTTTVPVATVAPTTPPVDLNAAPAGGVDTVATANQTGPQLDQRTAIWPWFLLGAVLIAAAALLLLNRRRGGTTLVEESHYAPRVGDQVAAAAPVVVPPPAPERLPALALTMRPLRAGIDEAGARVEFELTVANRGLGEARDVRVATRLLAPGAAEADPSPAEPAVGTPPAVIPAGEARTVSAQVALPKAEIAGDMLLPVVAADVSYKLPDGSAASLSARFAVGVPDGEALAGFDTEHPSGLHERVVAQRAGEPEPA